MKSSPRPKKVRMSRSRVKTMITVFFDSRGIVHKKFVPPRLLQRCLGTTSKTGPASSNGHCRRLGAAPR